MKTVIVLLALVAFPAMADEYVTVYVPEGKKIVVIDEDVDVCVSVKPVRLEEPSDGPDPDLVDCDEDELTFNGACSG